MQIFILDERQNSVDEPYDAILFRSCSNELLMIRRPPQIRDSHARVGEKLSLPNAFDIGIEGNM